MEDSQAELQSLGQRTIGADDQLCTTPLRCQWKQAQGMDQRTLDHWFSSDNRHLLATGLHHLKTAVEQQDNGVGPQRPMTASKHHGQWTMEPFVVLSQDCHGQQATSSHGTSKSTNVDGWASDGLQFLSISASTGAQLRNTDKASRTDMDSRTAAHDEEAGPNNTIGSTEPRPAALGGRLDFNEADRIAPSETDLFEQRSGPPSAESASGESSTSHPCYANPARPKVVEVSPQVDLDNGNVEEELVTCWAGRHDRFITPHVNDFQTLNNTGS